MKRLSFIQGNIMIALILFGVLFIVADLISPIFTFAIGYTSIFMGILLMFLECGPQVWYWWVPFGLGVKYDMDEQLYDDKYESIMHWTKDNFGESLKYYRYGNTFYFLQKTDAMAFKLAWEE